MAEIAQRYQDQLERIKKNIRTAHDYFKPNYDRFHEFRNFLYNTTLTDAEKDVLRDLGKPILEFNIGEPFVSRLRGEFSKQQPSVEVNQDDDANLDPQIVDVVDGHMRHSLFEANNNGFENKVWDDVLSGGFSVMKIWTEYAHSMAFNQVIKFGRVYDPTLCGFDPLAQDPHKGDGRYCFELYPKTKEEFQEKYPKIDIKDLKFTRTQEGFNWCYTNESDEKILLMCDYYEKKTKKIKIVQLANGKVLPESLYKEYLEQWQTNGHIQQPAEVLQSRWADTETVCRYIIIENQVIEYKETDYSYLPLIFVDGNSVLLRKGSSNGSVQQMTRPYIYNLRGVQKLKNFAAQTLGAGLENMVQHKWKVAKESIDPNYLEAYTNNQVPRVIIYNAIYDKNPEVVLPAPQEVIPIPLPPEVINTFQMMDQAAQMTLGSYDASLGINNNQLSGIAIQEGATQSNATGMPYVVGFMQGFNQLAQCYVDLMPKYLAKTRNLPIVAKDGEKRVVKINQPGALSLKYAPNEIKINIKAGVNFAIQKSRSLQQMEGLSQGFPVFAQFVNEECLDVLVDNMECKGADIMKERAKPFMQKMKMAQAANAQNNPIALKKQEIQQKAQRDQNEFIVQQQKNANESMEIQLDAQAQQNDQVIQAAKAQAEQTNDLTQLVLHTHDQLHSHAHAKAQLAHDILQSQQQHGLQQQQLEQQSQQPTGENVNA